MAWFAIHEEIEGPKLRNMYHLLGCSLWEAEGILVSLWRWGLKNAQKNGYIPYAKRGDIVQALSTSSAGSKLSLSQVVDVLIKSGWLDETEEGLYIHDWDVWQEYWYKAEEKREYNRQYQRRKKDASGDEQMQIPGSEEETPDAEEPPKYSKDFEEFWAAYPRHRDKGLAYGKYKARKKDGWSAEELLTAAKAYATQCARKGTEQEYIKHAKTFLSENTPFIDFLPKKPAEPPKPPDGSNPFEEYGGEG